MGLSQIADSFKRTSVFLALLTLVFNCSKSNDTPETNEEDLAEEKEEVTTESEEILPNIVDFISEVNNLTTTLAALENVDTSIKTELSSDGSTTFFVPTDAAFVEFLETLENYSGLSDFDETAEKEILTNILKYHIVKESTLFSDALSNDTVITTQQTEDLQIVVDGDIFLQDRTDGQAKIIDADNEVSNGVVHVIDKILLPDAVIEVLYPKLTVTQLIQETEELSLLDEALTKANLTTKLEEEGPFTVFAPTNAAIEQLFVLLGEDYNGFDDFSNILEQQVLKEILLGHMVEGNLSSKDFVTGSLPTLLPNDSIELIENESTFVIRDASQIKTNFVSFDLEASNGTVHIIDKILIPQKALSLLQ